MAPIFINIVIIIALYAGMAVRVAAGEFFVAPNGTPQGDGSRFLPWDIATALADNTKIQNLNYVVKPGDTIWLLGGTYATYLPSAWPYVLGCKLVGTSNSPIFLRQYPGERAIIDGGIYCGNPSDWVTFWGFEITCSRPRLNTYDQRPAGLIMSARGHKAVNLVVRDSGHPGIGGGGGEVYGCILWGVGIYEFDNRTRFPTNAWVRGSALYLQNSSSNTYLVSDNISRGSLNAGMKAYAENGQVQNFVFDGNIVFLNNGEGIQVECLNNPITNATVMNNFTYRCGKTPMGYFSSDSLAQHGTLIYSNNYVHSSPGTGTAAVWLKRWKNLQVVGNTTITTGLSNEWAAGSGRGADGMGGKFIEVYPGTQSPFSYTINSNAYYGGVEQAGPWYDHGIFRTNYTPFYYKPALPYNGTNGQLSFVYWQKSHGFDLKSAYTTNMPTANAVMLRTNKYELGRANLAVFNWQSNITVSVNLSGAGLTNGQRFEVRDVQDYFGTPVLITNYSAASPVVEIPLTNTNVTELSGIIGVPGFDPNVHTASLFNTFVILPRAQAGPRPPTELRVQP